MPLRKKSSALILLIPIFLFCVLLSSCNTEQQRSTHNEKYTLTTESNRAKLDDYLFAFKDAERTYSFKEVRQRPDLFTPVYEIKGNLVLGDENYWIRFTLTDSTSLSWSLRLTEPHVDYIHVYVPQNEGDYERVSYSTRKPFPGQDSSHRWFRLDLDIDRGETKTYYVNINQPPLEKFTVWETEKLQRYEYNYSFIIGGFLGLIAVLFLYNLYLFVSLKDIDYLYFALMTVAFISFGSYFRAFGYHFPALFPRDFGIKPFNIMGHFGLIFIFLFLRRFLNLKQFSRFLDKITDGIVVVLALFFIPNIIVDKQFLIFSILSGFILLLVVYFIAGVVVAISNKFKPVRYLIAGMGTFMFIAFVSSLINLGYEDIHAIIDFDISILVGTSLMVILFSFALSDKYHLFRKERESALLEKDSAERNNLEKTNFFINLAHEIKTPLTIISNYLDEFMKNNPTDLPKLSVLRRNVEKLKRDMINFFDVLRFEKGKIIYDHAQSASFSECVETAAQLYQEQAKRKHIRFTVSVETDVFIRMDPAAINRIVNNLFENALRYTEPEGWIDVRLACREETVRFTVENSGPGIEKEDIVHIFKPYYQLSTKKKSSEGMGLGLSLVKGILDETGGTIDAESTPGEKTAFTVCMPESAASEHNPEFYQAERGPDLSGDDDMDFPLSFTGTGGEKRQRVLIVEDNRELLSFYHSVLEPDYSVAAAFSGKSALKLVDGPLKPDIIVTDIMMDDMDGYRLIDELWKREDLKSIPVIFVTARSGIDEKLVGLKRGAVDFITKPFVIEELQIKIKNLLEIKECRLLLYENEKLASLGLLTGAFAHEIRNPLNHITGPVDNLKRILDGFEGEERLKTSKYISHIEEGIERIENIIHNIHSMQTSSVVRSETFTLHDIVASVNHRLHQFQSSKKEIIWNLSPDFTVVADRTMCEQVLYNVIRNGLEAIEGRGEVTITTEVSKREDGEKEKKIIIADNGKGIDIDEQHTMFEPYFSTKEEGYGLGLGLYITAQLAKRLGWTIQVESEPEKGTQIIITIED